MALHYAFSSQIFYDILTCVINCNYPQIIVVKNLIIISCLRVIDKVKKLVNFSCPFSCAILRIIKEKNIQTSASLNFWINFQLTFDKLWKHPTSCSIVDILRGKLIHFYVLLAR